MSAAEGAGFCAARGDQDYVRHPDEEAGADDAGYGSQVALEARRISNLTHPAIEHEVAVVSDELAPIVAGADARLQPQCGHHADAEPGRKLQHLHRKIALRPQL